MFCFNWTWICRQQIGITASDELKKQREMINCVTFMMYNDDLALIFSWLWARKNCKTFKNQICISCKVVLIIEMGKLIFTYIY